MKTGKKVVLLVGPTAVGKTDVAIRLAEKLTCAIVSADSRQFYHEMKIGTAPPSVEEQQRIPHYFIGNISIDEEWNAARYGDEARAAVDRELALREVVIVCGGSGLYVKAFLEGFDEIPDVPAEIRNQLTEQYRAYGKDWLRQQVRELDPEFFNHADVNNPHRMLRALEIRMSTGKSILEFRTSTKRDLPYQVVKIGLDLSREVLYDRINQRVDRMITAGLEAEARALLPYRDRSPLQTVGYQEFFDFFEGRITREEAIELIKKNTRNYAKRQLTWFRKDKYIQWFHPDEINLICKTILES